MDFTQTDLTEIQTKIGIIRVSRNVKILNTSLLTLSTMLIGSSMVISPSITTGIAMSVVALTTGINGIDCYRKQKELNILKKEKQKILIK